MSARTELIAWLGAAARAIARPIAGAARWAVRPVAKLRRERMALTKDATQFTRQANETTDQMRRTLMKPRRSLTRWLRKARDGVAALRRPATMDNLREPAPRAHFGLRQVPPEAVKIVIGPVDRARAQRVLTPGLADDVAGISAAARGVAEAVGRKAFRNLGGWDHPQLDVMAAVRELGLDRAVEMSRICQRIAAARGQGYVVDPAAWVADNSFILNAQARGWVIRSPPAQA